MIGFWSGIGFVNLVWKRRRTEEITTYMHMHKDRHLIAPHTDMVTCDNEGSIPTEERC
jgi:hypothetical protein